jgi:hypothetical protein
MSLGFYKRNEYIQCSGKERDEKRTDKEEDIEK